MSNNTPDPEKGWNSNSETPESHEATHTDPLTDEEGSEDNAFDAELKKEFPSHDSAEFADNVLHTEYSKEFKYLNADDNQRPLGLQRTRTDATAATATSVGTEPDQPQIPVQRKRGWLDTINPLKTKTLPPIPKERIPSREYQANIFSVTIFQWVSPLMSVGYQRPLELNDVWWVNPDRSVPVLKQKFREAFKHRNETGSKRPLLRALYDTFRREFWIGGTCQLIGGTLSVIVPFVMRYIIAFAAEAYEAQKGFSPAPPVGRGIGLVFAITLMQVIQTTTTNHFMYRGMLVGGQCRGVLISVIFDKAEKLSGRAKAGGRAEDVTPPSDLKPGSEEEKAHFKRKLDKDAPVSKKGVEGEGVGWSNGRIVNLMSTDAYRLDQASGLFHMAWTSPLQALLSLALLLINLKQSALSGFAFIAIMMPLLARAVTSMMTRRQAVNKITDQRVSLTQEIISSVRFVKYFGWERSFLDRVAKLRTREISRIAFLLSVRNAILAVSLSMPVFASMLAFITYSLTNDTFNAAPVFSSLGLFNSLRIPLNILSTVIGQLVDANASAIRIQEFLNAEETRDEVNWDDSAKDGIIIENGDFTWERTRTQESEKQLVEGGKNTKQMKQAEKENQARRKQEKRQSKQMEKQKLEMIESSPDTTAGQSLEEEDEEQKKPFELKDINLTVGRDELVAVIGSVGSGKSSLLAALAGDMRKTNGSLTLGSARSFVPQYAWIQNETFKENIIFGKEFDRRRYNAVLDACALRPDLAMLPNGDMTEIGERGITISGGQKQRLNIARAIYFNTDVVLMDDPLSAVDAHVGRHIMDYAICGLLKGKARVLATHQLHVLHRVDRIVWMKEGCIHKIATFQELMEHDSEFQHLMETTAAEEKDENKGTADDADEKQFSKKKTDRKSAVALMQREERAVSSVSGEVYLAYIRASGSILVGPLIFFLLLLSQGTNIANSLWLSYWTSNKFGVSKGVYIGVYAALAVLQTATLFAFCVTLTIFGTRSSRVMLNRAIKRVLRAPMSFFDTTPMGRITNRFSKDVDTMDNVLTESIRMFSVTFSMIVSVFVLIIAYYYFFAIALAPLTVLFFFAASYYRSSARELKRHEAVLRSDVFARFGEALNGIATIRAYGMQGHFIQRLDYSIDSMNGAYFLTFANQRWLATRLDMIGNLLVFTLGILVVTSRFSINPSIGGLVLSYMIMTVTMIQFTIRQLAEVENNMNSTERIHYYGSQLEQEAPEILGELPPQWPDKGEIVFDDVQMRYRPDLPLVLKGMSVTVRPGERIGVVGRTGAGKSSIMATLFRLVELSGGKISIDGVNIATIGLQDLRARMSIIPQDPTLFRGTIRSNLDPFNEHDDLALWNALRQADLVGAEQGLDDEAGRIHLDTPVEDEGLNFSLGQRQLLALARALVRGSRIIVCDEATSSVDFETDQRIQRTIVRGFQGSTLLCIAHRLKTIIGYDRILVMDQGDIAELDTPITLYDRPDGIFRSMCDRSGIRRDDFFHSDEANFALQRVESIPPPSPVVLRRDS